MKNYLILQVLGSSDIRVDGEEGTKKLEACYTLEDVQQAEKWNDAELIDELDRVDFPLIRQVWEEHQNQANLHFGIILTNQVSWMQSQNESGEGWNDIVTSDGYWWRNILDKWCQQQGINYYPIYLNVDSTIDKGAADWEGMANSIDSLLNGLIKFPTKTDKSQSDSIIFEPTSGQTIEVDQIILQHSSGTPALSGALYLWGIEQKLDKQPLDFVYISRQDSISYPHSGVHWQWRLKVPQIKQLLAIQDFAGAYELLTAHTDTELQKKCKYLDRAVSLNLAELNLGLNPSDEVIERISIALWSEKAFRERGQWMHWYLRVAGAFELVIACLIVKQGAAGAYQWQKNQQGKTFLEYQPNPGNRCELNPGLAVTIRVNELLSNGQVTYRRITYNRVTPITNNPDWDNFKGFYCGDKWELEPQMFVSFTHLRNELYHALLGDTIDKILDAQTAKLGSVDHKEHPSEVAVEHLKYIIQLAGLSSQVQQRVQHYETMVEAIKGSL